MNKSASSTTSYIDIMEKNHMEIPWHDYASDDSERTDCPGGTD